MAVADEADDWLNVARIDARLSIDEPWHRYVALAGTATRIELEAYLRVVTATDHNHDLIAHDVIADALNERFVELAATIRGPMRSGDPRARQRAEHGSDCRDSRKVEPTP